MDILGIEFPPIDPLYHGYAYKVNDEGEKAIES